MKISFMVKNVMAAALVLSCTGAQAVLFSAETERVARSATIGAGYGYVMHKQIKDLAAAISTGKAVKFASFAAVSTVATATAIFALKQNEFGKPNDDATIAILAALVTYFYQVSKGSADEQDDLDQAAAAIVAAAEAATADEAPAKCCPKK